MIGDETPASGWICQFSSLYIFRKQGIILFLILCGNIHGALACRLAQIPKVGKILDIGAGTGAFGYVFKELGYEVVCVDIAPRMIEMCKKNGLEGLVCDIVKEGIPFPDNSFDLVIAAQFLHGLHSFKRKKLYEDSKRVSKNNQMMIYEYNIHKKNRLKARFYEWIEAAHSLSNCTWNCLSSLFFNALINPFICPADTFTGS